MLPPISLSGPAPAVAAVTSILQDIAPLPASICWRLRDRPDGQVELRDGDRTTVAGSWERCVRNHLAPAVGAVRVVGR